MFIVTGWQCDYYKNNKRCEEYSKNMPKDNNKVYCDKHHKEFEENWNKIKKEAINTYKQKVINYLKLCIDMDDKRLQTKLYNESHIKGSIEQTALILELIKNGVFD